MVGRGSSCIHIAMLLFPSFVCPYRFVRDTSSVVLISDIVHIGPRDISPVIPCGQPYLLIGAAYFMESVPLVSHRMKNDTYERTSNINMTIIRFKI